MAASSSTAWLRNFCSRFYAVSRFGKLHAGSLSVQQSRCLIRTSRQVTTVSQFPPVVRRGGRSEEDEELDFEIDDTALEALAKQHRAEAKVQNESSEQGVKFSDFPISPQLADRLLVLGYEEPFEVQSKTLPLTLGGRDVITRAQTGSGKTLAFSIPIVQKLTSRKPDWRSKKSPRAIVISPTRELCLQIYRSLQELDPRLRCLPVYGGESFFKQQSSITKRGVDVVCATPGRLKDHLERGTLSLDCVEFLCLDEADHLLNPEFLIQIENVLENSPRDKQMMLFSATMPPDIVRITNKYMKEASFVDLTTSQKAPSSVKHLCMNVPRSYHIDTVVELMSEYKPERCIVFIKTKVMTKNVARILRNQGLDAQELHSDLSQARRQNILSAFRTGQVDILVATDVAARGLDIPEVDLVVQVEPPANGIDFYIHRSGRTGRAGREGLAIMIHSGSRDDWEIVNKIDEMVQLNHTKPPNYQTMKLNKLVNIAKKLKHVHHRDVESALPTAEELLKESGEDGGRILAAALSLLAKGDAVIGPESRTREPHRPNFRNSSSLRPRRRDSNFFQKRRQYNDDDDDDEW